MIFMHTEPAVAPDDDALQQFLSRENSPKNPKKQPKKNRRPLIAFLIAVLVVAALAAVIVILNAQPTPEGTSDADIADTAQIKTSLNSEKEHTVTVPAGADGTPAQNGAGELLCYAPADVLEVSVTNASGAFTLTSETPGDEATVYTLTGFEGYPLQSGAPDALANDAAELPFITVASVGGDPADFGLDIPRATVRVKYADETSATILVGDEAPASAGVYVALSEPTAVFLVTGDAVDSFLGSVTDLISLTVTDSAESVDTADLIRLTISGSSFPEDIAIEPNPDDPASYRVTAPEAFDADVTESADIAGSIRGLYADSVAAVLPVDGNPFELLRTYGLETPYAEIVAEYPDATIRLRASAPDDEGKVCLMNLSDEVTGERIVYVIEYGALSWASTSLEALTPAE